MFLNKKKFPIFLSSTAAFMILSNAESFYRIENEKDNKNSQETDLEGIEEPMKSAIKLMRRKLPESELRERL